MRRCRQVAHFHAIPTPTPPGAEPAHNDAPFPIHLTFDCKTLDNGCVVDRVVDMSNNGITRSEFISIKKALEASAVSPAIIDGVPHFVIYEGFKFYRSQTKDKRILRKIKRSLKLKGGGPSVSSRSTRIPITSGGKRIPETKSREIT